MLLAKQLMFNTSDGVFFFESEFIYILQILSMLVPLDTEQVKGLHTLVCWYN
jgi:hypothetical protein